MVEEELIYADPQRSKGGMPAPAVHPEFFAAVRQADIGRRQKKSAPVGAPSVEMLLASALGSGRSSLNNHPLGGTPGVPHPF
ncbi:MAG: hypothetical protein AB3N24_07045, partial [Leisingera sp.]